jgi:RNA polymerase sigma-70 factor (ECF subfamily)
VGETELVERARSGDREAMGQLYSAHASRVYTVVRRLAGDDALAEDLAQDAWIRAFRKLDLFRGEASFGTWMYRLATNMALNRLRRRDRREEVEVGAQLGHPRASLDDVVINQRILSQALDRLPPGYRRVLVLHDVEGHTHEEIAELLSVAPGTSKSQLHKARARMRELLEPGVSEREASNEV